MKERIPFQQQSKSKSQPSQQQQQQNQANSVQNHVLNPRHFYTRKSTTTINSPPYIRHYSSPSIPISVPPPPPPPPSIQPQRSPPPLNWAEKQQQPCTPSRTITNLDSFHAVPRALNSQIRPFNPFNSTLTAANDVVATSSEETTPTHTNNNTINYNRILSNSNPKFKKSQSSSRIPIINNNNNNSTEDLSSSSLNSFSIYENQNGTGLLIISLLLSNRYFAIFLLFIILLFPFYLISLFESYSSTVISNKTNHATKSSLSLPERINGKNHGRNRKNVSASLRLQTLWMNHIVIGKRNIFLSDTFESRLNAEVAPILQPHISKIWQDNFLKCQKFKKKHAILAFSLDKSGSLPASITLHHNPKKKNYVNDIRDINIILPGHSSRHSFSVHVKIMKDINKKYIFDVLMGGDLLEVELSDISRLVLRRYCGRDRRLYKNDLLKDDNDFDESNSRSVPLSELKRLFNLISGNQGGSWDARGLSKAVINPIEHSNHGLSVTHVTNLMYRELTRNKNHGMFRRGEKDDDNNYDNDSNDDNDDNDEGATGDDGDDDYDPRNQRMRKRYDHDENDVKINGIPLLSNNVVDDDDYATGNNNTTTTEPSTETNTEPPTTTTTEPSPTETTEPPTTTTTEPPTTTIMTELPTMTSDTTTIETKTTIATTQPPINTIGQTTITAESPESTTTTMVLETSTAETAETTTNVPSTAIPKTTVYKQNSPPPVPYYYQNQQMPVVTQNNHVGNVGDGSYGIRYVGNVNGIGIGGMIPLHQGMEGMTPSRQGMGGMTPSRLGMGGMTPSRQRMEGMIPAHTGMGGMMPSYAGMGGMMPSYAGIGMYYGNSDGGVGNQNMNGISHHHNVQMNGMRIPQHEIGNHRNEEANRIGIHQHKIGRKTGKTMNHPSQQQRLRSQKQQRNMNMKVNNRQNGMLNRMPVAASGNIPTSVRMEDSNHQEPQQEGHDEQVLNFHEDMGVPPLPPPPQTTQE